MKFLGCEAICLDRPIIAKGYNGVRGHPITHYVLIDLVIDRRRLVEIPFLILTISEDQRKPRRAHTRNEHRVDGVVRSGYLWQARAGPSYDLHEDESDI
jgi:hypothetical protein